MKQSTSYPWLVLRTGPLSVRIDRRVPLVVVLATAAMLAGMVINIGVGEYPIAPLDVLRTVFRLPTANPDHDFIVNTLRLPRMLVAALVGLALGVSGAIMQGLTRNPLADPGIIGVSAGAALVAVTLIVVVPDVPSALLPVGAFAGSAIIAFLIYVLAWRGGDSPIRLILVGVGLGAVTGAATTLMTTFGEINDVQRALVWLSGSVYGRSWKELWALLPWVVVLVPLAFALARQLNALNLGEEIARGLGSRVALDRGLLLLAAVALAGASVAAAGTIGFVGLIAPHIARRLVGPAHEGVLPTSGILGALIVVLADLVGRTIIAPTELPCGLITAAIGAPFFLYLLWQGRRD
jgi:iron complex transport system permease protein